jgi:hypothetical protein
VGASGSQPRRRCYRLRGAAPFCELRWTPQGRAVGSRPLPGRGQPPGPIGSIKVNRARPRRATTEARDYAHRQVRLLVGASAFAPAAAELLLVPSRGGPALVRERASAAGRVLLAAFVCSLRGSGRRRRLSRAPGRLVVVVVDEEPERFCGLPGGWAASHLSLTRVSRARSLRTSMGSVTTALETTLQWSAA